MKRQKKYKRKERPEQRLLLQLISTVNWQPNSNNEYNNNNNKEIRL
jgi:hypothetical protein